MTYRANDDYVLRMNAHYRGVEDYKLGKEENPYEKGTLEHNEYIQGWLYARGRERYLLSINEQENEEIGK